MKTAFCAILLSLLSLPALAAEVEMREDASRPYLFDAIKDKGNRKAIETLLKRQALPAWTRAILSGGNYVAGAPSIVSAPLPDAIVYDACMPHDCFDNRLELVITADRKKAYGLLRENGRSRFLGNPGPKTRQILKASQPQ